MSYQKQVSKPTITRLFSTIIYYPYPIKSYISDKTYLCHQINGLNNKFEHTLVNQAYERPPID